MNDPDLIKDVGRQAVKVILLVLAMSMASCGGGGGGGAAKVKRPSGEQIETSLNELGVETTETPRLGPDGNPLPDDYNPLGAAFKVAQKELLFAGFRHALNAGNDSKHPGKTSIVKFVPPTFDVNGKPVDPYHWDSLDANAYTADLDWENWESSSVRAATAGDFDLDGRDEIVIVYRDLAQAGFILRIIDDKLANFSVHEEFLIPTSSTDNPAKTTAISVAAADTNGDGRDELIVGVSENGIHTLYRFASDSLSGFVQQNAIVLTPLATVTDSKPDWRIVAGNLDLDRSEEIAVVINQFKFPGGHSDYFVFDDANSNLALRASDQSNITYPAHTFLLPVADVAIADVDNSGIGNLVLGGISELNTNCTNLPDYVVAVYDLVASSLKQLAATYGKPQYSRNTGCTNATPFYIHGAWTHVVDMEGNGTQNIVINQMVFNSDITSWSSPSAMDPNSDDVDYEFSEQFLPNSTIYAYYHLRADTTAVAVADINSNGKDNIILYHRFIGGSPAAAYPEVRVLESVHDAIQDRNVYNIVYKWNVITNAAPPSQAPSVTGPIIIAADVDDDGMVMTPTLENSHEFIFSAPIVQAVLAAPPCRFNIGQNTDACTTSFGKGSSIEWKREGETSIKASITWGWDINVGVSWIPGAMAGSKAKFTAELGLKVFSAHAYNLEKSITYQSGPMEDTVIFTTVPYDRYNYTILSHTDPAKIGTHAFIMLPRDPITVQVERSYYNAHVQGGPVVGSSVLPHTIGYPETYYTLKLRNSLLEETYGILSPGPLYSYTQTVAESRTGASNYVTLVDAFTATYGAGFSLSASFEMEFTAGPGLAGYSVGIETNQSIQRTAGTRLSYSGTVGSIDEAHWVNNKYNYGLFTYQHTDPNTGQQYSVINYWVE